MVLKEMEYQIIIKPHNQKPHLDIEEEINRIKNGNFTILIRYAEKKINDVVFLSYDADRTFLKTWTVTTQRRIKYPFHPDEEGCPLELYKLKKNLKFHMLIEKKIFDIVYGQSTFNVVLRDCIAL